MSAKEIAVRKLLRADEQTWYCGSPDHRTHPEHAKLDAIFERLTEATAELRQENERLKERLPCGHEAHYMLKSAETGLDLFCEICNCKDERRDALNMEAHYKSECQRLRRELAQARDQNEDYRKQVNSLGDALQVEVDARVSAEAEVQRLQEALGDYANRDAWGWTGDGYVWNGSKYDYRVPPYEVAEAALKEQP